MSQSDREWPKEELLPPYLDIPGKRVSEFDPPTEVAELQGRQDPARIPFHAGHAGWIVTGHELAKKVLSDGRFSVRPDRAHGEGAGELVGYSGPGLFHLEDPPEHTRLRSTVTAEFTPAKTRAWESKVSEIAHECLDSFLRNNTKSAGDFVPGFAVPFPAMVVTDYLGMPQAARDLFLYTTRRRAGDKAPGALSAIIRLFKQSPSGTRHLLYHAARRVVTRTSRGEDRAEALATVADFMKQTIATVRGEDSFLGRLGTRSDISEDEAAGVAAQVLIAGSVVPASMLGLAIKFLLTTPRGLQPFAGGSDAAVRATEEVFRYLSFESQPRIRVATEDVTIGDAHIRAGQLVAVTLETANRDPEVFNCPNSLDFERDSTRHLAFGWGAHQCLGQNLARLEIRVALEAIAQRLPQLQLQHPGESHVSDESIVHAVTSLPVRWGAKE